MHRVGFVLFLVLVLLGSSLALSPPKAAQANIGPLSSHGEGIEPLEGGEGVRMMAEQVYNPQYSTLQEVRVLVDGETVPYETLTRTDTASGGYLLEAQWAVWPVSFQPEQGREIEVSYTVTAYRGTERIRIDYSLRTGAAWAGTIGQSLIELSAPFPIEDGQVSAKS
ncbi:MAG: hypothetical protein WCP58_12775 [bacterium]